MFAKVCGTRKGALNVAVFIWKCDPLLPTTKMFVLVRTSSSAIHVVANNIYDTILFCLNRLGAAGAIATELFL